MELLEEFGALTSHQVADLAGSRAQNRAALAAKLKSQGKVFSVDVDGTAYFPAFQFDESGQPLPVIERILSHLGPALTEWELALWFTSANGWLEDRRPVDELGRQPDRVVEAAAREHAQFDD